ncbi:MAG TPA: alpha/beta fold hydrolase [Chloroflexia bacterium]|nr:alpha/beta fold hydrolase [Chloroflexia bacterium]
MVRRSRAGGFALGVVAGVGVGLAAMRVAYAPPDPRLEARARDVQYMGPWRHGFVMANGVRLHYAEMGSGPLVVLLHGFPQCWYQWRYVMPRLAEQFRVVAVDMRGYNLSDKPEGVRAYSANVIARDIVAFVEALGEERAHIVGHDWGGLIAWHIGANHPEHVNKLVVVNAPHPAAYRREALKLEQLLRSYYVFLFQLPVLPEAMLRLTLRGTLPSSAAVPGAFSPDALDVYQNNISQPGAATAMIHYYRAAFRESLGLMRQDDRTIHIPTMLLWGMKDFALVPRLTEGLEAWVPGIRVERNEESGHWVPEEKPGWVADKLLDFLP